MEMNQFYAHSCVRLCVLKEGSAAQICAPGFTGQMHKMNIKLKLKLKLPLRHSGIHWKKAEKTDSEAVRKSERQHPVPQGRAFLFPPLLQIHFGFFGKKLRKLSDVKSKFATPEWSDPHAGHAQIYEGCSAKLSPLCTRLTAQLRAISTVGHLHVELLQIHIYEVYWKKTILYQLYINLYRPLFRLTTVYAVRAAADHRKKKCIPRAANSHL